MNASPAARYLSATSAVELSGLGEPRPSSWSGVSGLPVGLEFDALPGRDRKLLRLGVSLERRAQIDDAAPQVYKSHSFPLFLPIAARALVSGVRSLDERLSRSRRYDLLRPIDPEHDEPVFHADWERRVFAMNIAALGFSGRGPRRHAIERMDPVEYLSTSYYEHWLAGLVTLAKDLWLRDGAEIDAGRAAAIEPTPFPAPHAAQSRASCATACPQSVDAADRTAFGVGDAVRARNIEARATRGCRATCGASGRRHRAARLARFPDTAAHDRGETRNLCTPCGPKRKSCGARTWLTDCVYIDLWEGVPGSAAGGRSMSDQHQITSMTIRTARRRAPITAASARASVRRALRARREARAAAHRERPRREGRARQARRPLRARSGPMNSAKVVARAWVDADFKRRLLGMPRRAIAELGFGGLQGEHMVVVENTPGTFMTWSSARCARVTPGPCSACRLPDTRSGL